jgi:hypothetical protein
MRLLLTGVSALALASFAQTSGALAQEATGAERGADEITCAELARLDTALVPGVLYFVMGHGAGAGHDADADEMAAGPDDPEGELAGMEDATAAQEATVADDEPGPAVAGTERDPAMDADAEAAEDWEAPETDTADADEAGAAEDGLALDAAAEDPDAAPEMGAEPELAEADDAEIVRVRGHFQIPIEATVLACAEDPEARVADVVEAQRGAAIAGEEAEDDEEG